MTEQPKQHKSPEEQRRIATMAFEAVCGDKIKEYDRKLLTEYLGEKYHEWERSYYAKDEFDTLCITCRATVDKSHENRTFTTIQDFYDLKVKMVELGEWEEFYRWGMKKYAEECIRSITQQGYANWLFRPESCALVDDYLKQKGTSNAHV
jgi:hypothetical protein